MYRSTPPAPAGAAKPLVHLTPGEIIVPQHVLTPDLQAELAQAFANAGLDPLRYRVAEPKGSERKHINAE